MNNFMHLDITDKKLLYYLDMNARESLSVVAKKLRISKSVLVYRLNRLKSQSVIQGSYAEINTPLLGYYSFRIFLKLGNYTTQQETELSKALTQNKNLMWHSKVIGKWDIDIVYLTKSIGEFEQFRVSLFAKYNAIIEKYNISLLTRIDHYPRDYLLQNTRTSTPHTLTLTEKTETIDTKDEQLLRLLSEDASLTIIELSKRLKLSINTTKKKIKQLEKKKIILAYRLFINLDALGYNYYKIHINLKNYTEKDTKRIHSWLGTHANVAYIDHYLTAEDLEVELHTLTEKEYLDFMKTLQQEFGTIIKSHFTIKFYDVKVFRYLPLL